MSTIDDIVCSSCGLAGWGKYCSRCGALLRTQLPTIRELGAELQTEVLSLHRRAFRTLAIALIRPGGLTEAYRDGHGSAFISPIKLYVPTAAIFFATNAMLGEPLLTGPTVERVRPDIVLALALPVLAFWLKLFYGLIGGLSVRYSESLSFAITYQSAFFAITSAMLCFDTIANDTLMQILGLALAAYLIWHMWRGARRLWSERGILGPLRAAGIVLFHFGSALGVAMLLGTLLRV
jgi:hypothetical protein